VVLTCGFMFSIVSAYEPSGHSVVGGSAAVFYGAGVIRVKALAVVRPEDGAVLVCEGADRSLEGFARPPGGSVEFGELALEAVHREIREEFSCGLKSVSLMVVLENCFELNGVPGHGVVFVFRADVPTRRSTNGSRSRFWTFPACTPRGGCR
jgi:ADP-ribose pyrophosphatase YjhB (NUDIX family)